MNLRLPSPQPVLSVNGTYGSEYGVKDPEGAFDQPISGLPGAYARYRRKSMCRAHGKFQSNGLFINNDKLKQEIIEDLKMLQINYAILHFQTYACKPADHL